MILRRRWCALEGVEAVVNDHRAAVDGRHKAILGLRGRSTITA